MGDLSSPYNVAPLPPGMSEDEFMDRINEADGWNDWLWTPWINDCHTDLENAFEDADVPYPGAPNGRLDVDDNIRNAVSDGLNSLAEFLSDLPNIYQLFGGI